MNIFINVSIIIPVFNAEKYIRHTLNSVLVQTYTNFEVLIVNDKSTDRSVDIVREFCCFDNRFKLIDLTQKAGGAAAVRNAGILESRGEWVAFLDADDIWHPRKLERQIELLFRTGALFCSTGMRNFVNDSDLALSDSNLTNYEWISFRKQLIKFRTPTSSVLLHRSIIEASLFNEDKEYRVREDLDCWLHCHEKIQRSVKIVEPMVGYRISQGQVSGNKLKMIIPHYQVLSRYIYLSGRRMNKLAAVFFTFTHVLLALHNRFYKKGM